MTSNMKNLVDELIDSHTLLDDAMSLKQGETVIKVKSNSQPLLDQLKAYFAHVVSVSASSAIEIIAIERETLQLDYPFQDWKREYGKQGRKDSYFDLDKARLLSYLRLT